MLIQKYWVESVSTIVRRDRVKIVAARLYVCWAFNRIRFYLDKDVNTDLERGLDHIDIG